MIGGDEYHDADVVLRFHPRDPTISLIAFVYTFCVRQQPRLQHRAVPSWLNYVGDGRRRVNRLILTSLFPPRECVFIAAVLLHPLPSSDRNDATRSDDMANITSAVSQDDLEIPVLHIHSGIPISA